MTLITACLDATLTARSVASVICGFVARLFTDKMPLDIEEYISREIPQHISGWRSTATVRKICPRAQDIWSKLEKQGVHQPGYIPEEEIEELIRMLFWLVSKDSDVFYTTSSDIYSLGIMLAELGFEPLRPTTEKKEHAECGSITLVKTDEADILPMNHQVKRQVGIRRGIRVPLANMEDAVISFCPDNPDESDRRRMRFAEGMRSAADISFSALVASKESRNAGLAIRVSSKQHAPSPNDQVFTLMDRYFLFLTNQLLYSLTKFVKGWNIGRKDLKYLSELGTEVLPGEEEGDLGQAFQIFLLGYYYCALGSIVDTSQLLREEVLGSWGWRDPLFFRHLRNLTKTRLKTGNRENLYWRFSFLRLVGYLFAGAEDESLALVNNEAASLVGKITVLTPGLLGDADTPEKLSKLFLLDVDTSAIPTNGQGIIKTAKSSNVQTRIATNYVKSLPLEMGASTSCGQDFTSHIEPAWGYNINLVQVVYRLKGRLVTKVDPLETEDSVLRFWPPAPPPMIGINWTYLDCEIIRKWLSAGYSDNEDTPSCMPSIAIQSHLDYCTGRIYAGPSSPSPEFESLGPSVDDAHVTIVQTKNLYKARCCILAMYCHVLHDGDASLLKFPWPRFFPGCLVAQLRPGELVVIR